MSWLSSTLRNVGLYPQRNPIDKLKKHFLFKVMPDLERFWDAHEAEIIKEIKKMLVELSDDLELEEKAARIFKRLKLKIRQLANS